MAPRPVRAALFDMDGTLLDIEPLSTLAINQQCAPFARSSHSTPR
jgi:beta-phosphoglucomutase-like phosphatase (HAD superfamily)